MTETNGTTTTTNETEQAIETETAETNEPKAKKAKAKKTKAAKAKADAPKPGSIVLIDSGDEKQFARIKLPEYGSPLWDAKMENEVPDALIKSIAEHGFRGSSFPEAIPGEGDALDISHGRTRIRAVEPANKIRAKHGLPPVIIPILVTDEGVQEARRMGHKLNSAVQAPDPITTASSILYDQEQGDTEDEIAKAHSIKVEDVSRFLAMLGFPEPVKDRIKSGEVTVAVALAMSDYFVEQSADPEKLNALIDKVTAGGEKLSAAAIKRVAKDEPKGPGRPGIKQVQGFLDELKASPLKGRHAEAVTGTATLLMEWVLTGRGRTVLSAKLEDLASGESSK